MELLSEIIIHRPNGEAAVQLLHGDLSSLPKEHKTDILVISAYPGDYTPLEGSLMGALYRKGVDVGELSLSKAVDLRSQLHCWLSKPLAKDLQERLNVKSLLCFEPGNMLDNSEEVVGNIFRCINAFAFEQQFNVVALPIVTAGYQKVPLSIVFPVLVDAAAFWLENGLPLHCIKLVIYRQEQVPQALQIFTRAKQAFESKTARKKSNKPGGASTGSTIARNSVGATTRSGGKAGPDDVISGHSTMRSGASSALPQSVPASAPMSDSPQAQTKAESPKDEYDYFISYAHTHSELINSFVDLVKLRNGQLNIFYDRDSIPPGSQWIRQLSSAIQKAKKVLIFLSPDYDKSPVCWDEFQCAKLMEYNKRKQIIQTIYLYDYLDIEMPPIMGIYSYIDCREGDPEKLRKSIEKIIEG